MSGIPGGGDSCLPWQRRPDDPGIRGKQDWGYEFVSAGYGTFRMTVLDEDADVVYGADEPSSPTGSAGGGEFASGGTFRLGIEADEDAKYAVVVCDGTHPSGGDRARDTFLADSRGYRDQ